MKRIEINFWRRIKIEKIMNIILKKFGVFTILTIEDNKYLLIFNHNEEPITCMFDESILFAPKATKNVKKAFELISRTIKNNTLKIY